MKKLKFNIEGKGILSKNQMKKIIGSGYECYEECNSDDDCQHLYPWAPYCTLISTPLEMNCYNGNLWLCIPR